MTEEDIAAGLANERTMLAWNRTGLSFLAVAGLAVKALPAEVDGVARAALVVVAGLVGTTAWGYSYVRYRAASRGRQAGAHVHEVLRVLTVGTGALAAVALVVAVL